METASGVGAEAEMEIGKGIVLSYTKVRSAELAAASSSVAE
jgi:hypothetical protein